jgi:hypothetical protein
MAHFSSYSESPPGFSGPKAVAVDMLETVDPLA